MMQKLRWMLRFMKQYRRLLWITFACAAVSGVLALFAPSVMGNAIDLLTAEGGQIDFAALARRLLLLAVLYGVSALFSWLAPVLASRIAGATVSGIRKETFRHLADLPLRYFDTHKHGDIVSRFTNDAENIADALNQSFIQLFGGIVTVVGTLVAMLLLSPLIALLVLCITPLSLLMAKFVILRSAHLFAAQQKELGALQAQAEEIISARTCVHLYGMEEKAAEDFTSINTRLYRVGWKAQFISALTNPSTRLINNISYISVGVVGALFALTRGNVTVGTIAALLTYATQFAKPINEIAGVTTQIQSALASAERIAALQEEPAQPSDGALPALADVREGAVRFTSLSFAYTPDRPLIRNLDLTVRPGSVVAIVGRTGAGKTTLVNLLMRFYEPDAGRIAVDGTDIGGVRRDSLRLAFSMVLQDTWLFTGTVRDNIAYGRPDATMEEIVASAKEAHAHDFIKRLPQGYDTVIQGDGGALSQGQRQLLTIARAMLAHAPMLILDEATSSVDILTEQYIQQAFTKMMVGHTSFIIAHRLATIRHADTILVMENGDIAEQGTHDELLRKRGKYWELVQSAQDEM